jgi:osmoprotectant transport system substrate-binding protein/osmoprotectant transport system permease protein
MPRFAALSIWGLLAAAVACEVWAQEPVLRIGSKRFTESYILGEIAVQSARRAGAAASHQPGMGNTAILVQALTNGAIDAYPEYAGTISREILQAGRDLDPAEMNARLAPLGLAVSVPLGFSNSYAIGVRSASADERKLSRISDLAGQTSLKLGFSHEFMGREDGWPGLQQRYALQALSPRALDHGLAYEALAAREVDAIDLYSTDAKIARYGIRVLEDDRAYFPRYDALFLHRASVPATHPRAWAAIAALQGRLDEATMIRLNGRAELDGRDFASVAAEFLGAQPAAGRRSLMQAVFAPDFSRLLWQHVALVLGSLLAAIAVGVPIGIAAARVKAVAQPVLLAAGLVQTIPSLALLAFLIPLTGAIGVWPAMIALFLYALLPIVRNTHAGMLGVSEGLRQAGRALGLEPPAILRHVELPLAAPTILAGVKTAAVVNVGTATIAAFIGAGGFGERIAQGLALNDHVMLLAGALPAAALALILHVVFEMGERALVPAPLRGGR